MDPVIGSAQCWLFKPPLTGRLTVWTKMAMRGRPWLASSRVPSHRLMLHWRPSRSTPGASAGTVRARINHDRKEPKSRPAPCLRKNHADLCRLRDDVRARASHARGRDAADVPLTLTFGPGTLVDFHVITEEVIDPAPEHLVFAPWVRCPGQFGRAMRPMVLDQAGKSRFGRLLSRHELTRTGLNGSMLVSCCSRT